jgi:hypothetical protein
MRTRTKPLSTSEIARFAATFGEFLERLQATVAEAERLETIKTGLANLLRSPGLATVKVNGGSKAAGGGRRRKYAPIEPDKVLAAVKSAGANGATSGELASDLKVPVDRLRFVLYKLRDDGALRMQGKLSKARYLLSESKKAATVGTKAKAAKKGPRKKRASKKTAEPAAAPASVS